MVSVFSFEGMTLYVRLTYGQGGAPTYLIPTLLLHIHLSYPCVPALLSCFVLILPYVEVCLNSVQFVLLRLYLVLVARPARQDVPPYGALLC